MKHIVGSRLVTAVLVAAFAPAAMAATLMSDNFNSYTPGNLVPQGGWAAHSGAGSAPVQVVAGTSGNAITLTQTSGSREDVNRQLGAAMGAGDVWYAGYTVTVSGTVTSNDYFASLYQFFNGTNFFPTKVGVATSAGADFTFYIHQGSGSGAPGTPSATTQAWPTGFSFGTPHRLVASYDYTLGAGKLWIDPVCSLGPDGNAKIEVINTAGSALIEADMYAFRQGGNAAGTQVIDDVVVATTWAEACIPEPATIGLLGLGAVLLMGRRRVA